MTPEEIFYDIVEQFYKEYEQWPSMYKLLFDSKECKDREEIEETFVVL